MTIPPISAESALRCANGDQEAILGNIYGRLIAPNAGPNVGPNVGPNELIPIPDLAERWERLDDLPSALHLRRDVRCHHVAPVRGRQASTAASAKTRLSWSADDRCATAMPAPACRR